MLNNLLYSEAQSRTQNHHHSFRLCQWVPQSVGATCEEVGLLPWKLV